MLTRIVIAIGAAHYPRWLASLECCTRDAEAFVRVLTSRGEYRENGASLHCYRLYDSPQAAGAPTLRNVLRTIESVREECARLKAAEHHVDLYFYFSGHGILLEVKSNDRPRQEEGFLLLEDVDEARPYERKPRPPEFAGHLALSGLVSRLNEVKADRRLVFLDACHSGSDIRLKSGRRKAVALSLQDSSVKAAVGALPASAVYASSTREQVSWSGSPYSRWTAHLLQALDGDRRARRGRSLTVTSLAGYLADRLAEETPTTDAADRLNLQTPSFSISMNHDYHLVEFDDYTFHRTLPGDPGDVTQRDLEEVVQHIRDSIVVEVGEAAIRAMVEFGSVARREYGALTSNLNLLLLAANENSFSALQKGLPDIIRRIEEPSARRRIRVFSSFIEDKHADRFGADVHVLLLVRGPRYLESKLKTQPLFVLNLIRDGKVLMGEDPFREAQVSEAAALERLTFERLVGGEGGIAELQGFLLSSVPLVGSDLLAFVRTWKYVVIRCTQIGRALVDPANLETSFASLRRSTATFAATITSPVVASTLENALSRIEAFERKQAALTSQNWHEAFQMANVYIDAIRQHLEVIRRERQVRYSGFQYYEEMCSAVAAALGEVLKAAVPWETFDQVYCLTHASDDVFICHELYLRLRTSPLFAASNGGPNVNFLVYENPDILGRFNVRDNDLQFRYFSDEGNGLSETRSALAVYLGSGTLVGRLIGDAVKAFQRVWQMRSGNRPFSWGYCLINANPEGRPIPEWRRDHERLRERFESEIGPRAVEICLDKRGRPLATW